ncbi:sensory rhodopsin transducer [Sorangium sp. So ce388]
MMGKAIEAGLRGLPRDTDYASVIESDVPIVVQHTRLDSSPRR